MINGTNIVIDNMVYQKIMHWINKSEYEVSGLGKITYKDGRITVIDAILLPQKNGSTHTDIEGDVVGKAMFQLKDTPGDLRWWWHSHVNMDVFWSGTDRDTIEKISDGGWFVSTVFNKKHEMRSCLNMNAPLPLGFMDNIPTRPIQFLDQELVKAWDADYEKNVENFVTKFSRENYYPLGGGGYYPNEESRFQRSAKEGNGQLSLPGKAFGETQESTSAADDYLETVDSGDIRRMTGDEVTAWLAKRRAADKASPPTDINGKTGGW
jgi:hypothetical protein